MSERIEWELNPSQNTGVATVTSSRLSPEDIDASTIGDVSFRAPGGFNFSSIFDAFKNIDPIAAAALLGIPAIVKALGAGGSGAAASSAIPTTTPPPGTTTPPPVTTTPPPVTTTPPPGTTTPPPGTTTPPPTTDTTTTSTSPNPTEDELIRAGIPRELLPLLLKYGLGALASYLSYKSAKDAQEQAKGASFAEKGPVTSTRRAYQGSTYKPAAQGGLMTLAGGGVLNEKGPEDYGIGSLSDQYAFMEANMPAGEASQFDIYGNLIMPDPYFRTLTGNETDQLERDAAREYYKNPENAQLSYEIAKNLEDAVIARGGMGEVDVQETLRNIYNNPELRNIFFNYTDELKYAPMEAADLLDKDYELNKREAEGFTPDNNYIPGLAYELDRFNRDNPRIGRNLEFEMLKLVDPNAPRTFFRNYDYEEGEGNIRRGGGEGGIGGGYGGAAGGITSAKQPFYLGGPTDGMADEVPAHIDNKRPAALSDGEFVIPADVVSHLGNGNSNAGASRLYEMMDRVREARTGNRKQGIQINPNKFMPR